MLCCRAVELSDAEPTYTHMCIAKLHAEGLVSSFSYPACSINHLGRILKAYIEQTLLVVSVYLYVLSPFAMIRFLPQNVRAFRFEVSVCFFFNAVWNDQNFCMKGRLFFAIWLKPRVAKPNYRNRYTKYLDLQTVFGCFYRIE